MISLAWVGRLIMFCFGIGSNTPELRRSLPMISAMSSGSTVPLCQPNGTTAIGVARSVPVLITKGSAACTEPTNMARPSRTIRIRVFTGLNPPV
ncbi:hypothetical protein D3C80_1447310 [compost metagenome]